MSETYTVKSGDCLWDIAKSYYGYGHFWPSLYSFNNWAAARHVQQAGFIVNPNLIYPRQRLLLPDLDMQLLRGVIEDPRLVAAVRRADDSAAGRLSSRAGYSAEPLVKSAAQVAAAKRDNPAAYLGFKPFLAFEYDLNDLPKTSIETPVFTAEIEWSGKIVMQPVHDDALVTLSNHGAMMAHEFKADTVFGELGSEVSVTWKPGDKRPGFACNLTRAGHGPIPEIAIEADRDGTKFVLRWKPFIGRFRGYEFVAVPAAEITVRPRDKGTPRDTTGPTRVGNITSIPAPPPTTIATRSGNISRIPGPSGPVIAANPHHFRGLRVNPSGVAPLVGVVGSILLFIAANPEVLAGALLL